jgi:sirohydrochlorin ferrochelatase
MSADSLPLVAVAHGSKDPRAAATVSSLLGLVAARADGGVDGVDVRAAFLDHCAPSLRQVLGALGGRLDSGRLEGGRVRSCIVVPLLLTAAYHSKSDVPAQLAAASSAVGDAAALDVRCAGTLGPHPLLLAALERRLREAGVAVDSAADRARTAVVLAAAGSSDPAANRAIADLAAGWQRDRGWRAVAPAYASAAGPSPAQAVAALRAGHDADGARGPVVVATYLLAPGYFADKIRAAAAEAGASAVSGVLGAAPEVADVVLARYREAALAAGPGEESNGRPPLAEVPPELRHRLWEHPRYGERAVATPRLVRCSIRGNRRGTGVTARAPRRA